MDTMEKYNKEAEKEIEQFLFLCGKRDRILLLSQSNKNNVDEYVRLACISLVFGYRKTFLKIVKCVEKYIDKFLCGLDKVNGNFRKLDEWMNGFIENVEDREAQALSRELWQERKEKLDRNDFTVKLLLEV